MREPDSEILEIHERHHRRLRDTWHLARPWLKRGIAVAITGAIFGWILRPIIREWPVVGEQILAYSPVRFATAAVMFAVFLFVFRVLSWRTILVALGSRLPVAPVTRIWSTSELARYVPGVIWQVVGRVLLIRPYGVSGTVCSASQILELVIFLLANILLAVACLLFFGTKLRPEAKPWLYGCMALVPVLALVLHPKVFYGVLNRVLRKLRKPPLTTRLGAAPMLGLLGWAIVGLVWQSLALYVLVGQPLDMPLEKWWVIAGAYGLAWSAGFLAVWAPGGLGVRELVFMATMTIAAPRWAADLFLDERALTAYLAFLSILLRLWATAGELMLTGLAYVLDHKGALGHPDAPGRAALPTPVDQSSDEPADKPADQSSDKSEPLTSGNGVR